MRLLRRALGAVLLLAVLAAAVGLYFVAYPNLPEYEAPEALHYLEQWDATQRQTYYYTPQGTQVKGLEYDWFRALELPFSRDKFATPDYLARFGFLVDPAQKATALNPGNLPVGFARHEDDETGRAYLDVTCAACHTGELRYGGQAIRIDGGAAMHSLASTVPTLRGGAFGQALGMSMAFTYYNPLKFRRFAEQVLGERYEQDRAQLRHDFKQVLDRLLGTAYNDWHRGLYPTEEGFGRTDAFGRIANSVFGDAIDPANYRVANAPVSYPHLWDIWKFDWVQWNGSAMQPLARRRAGRDRSHAGQPRSRAVQGKLRALPRRQAQAGRQAFRCRARPGVAHEGDPHLLRRYRSDHGRQYRRPSLRPDTSGMDSGRAGSSGCAAVWRASRPARSRQPVQRQGVGLYHRLCRGARLP